MGSTGTASASGSGGDPDRGSTSVQGPRLLPAEQNCLWMTSSGSPGENMRLASVNMGEGTCLNQMMGNPDPPKVAYIGAAACGRTNPTPDSTHGHPINNVVDAP